MLNGLHFYSLFLPTSELPHVSLMKAKAAARTLTSWHGSHGDGNHTHAGNNNVCCGDRVKAVQLAVRVGLR